jgi:hypothetical protein
MDTSRVALCAKCVKNNCMFCGTKQSAKMEIDRGILKKFSVENKHTLQK